MGEPVKKECIIDNVFDRDSVGCELQCIMGYDCAYYQEPRKINNNKTNKKNHANKNSKKSDH